MKCLETRKRNDLTWRRYRTDDSRTTTTLEIPTAVMSKMGMGRLKTAMAAWLRGETTRIRQKKVQVLIAEGVKPLAIAHEMGISTRVVQTAKNKMLTKGKTK